MVKRVLHQLALRRSVGFRPVWFLTAEVIVISTLVVQGTLGVWHIGLLQLLGALTFAWISVLFVMTLVAEIIGRHGGDQARAVPTVRRVNHRRLPAVIGWFMALSAISTYAFTGSPLVTLGVAGICMILIGNSRLLLSDPGFPKVQRRIRYWFQQLERIKQ